MYAAMPDYGQSYTYGVSPLTAPRLFSVWPMCSPSRTSKGGNGFVRGNCQRLADLAGITQVESGLQIVNSGNAAATLSVLPPLELISTPSTCTEHRLTLFPVLTCNPTSGSDRRHQYLNPSCFAEPKGSARQRGLALHARPDVLEHGPFVAEELQDQGTSESAVPVRRLQPTQSRTPVLHEQGDPNLKLTYNSTGQSPPARVARPTGPLQPNQTRLARPYYSVGGRVT